MNVKTHYDNHLANFYAWMAGDFQLKTAEFKQFLEEQHIQPASSKIAVDLGAGHGIQSIPLAEIGFQVIAVDFSEQLLNELQTNAGDLPIKILYEDLRNIAAIARQPELIVCCGDTLAHLENMSEVETFLTDAIQTLEDRGKLLLTFRDYSHELTGTQRFIPVKSDRDRILTCVLEYNNEHVTVTDLLHEQTNGVWIQKISSYMKVRLQTEVIVGLLEKNGMQVVYNEVLNRMTTVIATKKQSQTFQLP